jgi:hypothetical protein
MDIEMGVETYQSVGNPVSEKSIGGVGGQAGLRKIQAFR